MNKQPTFIKVGANDGLAGDPCGNALLACSKWKGALIEPVPYIFTRLSTLYADTSRFNCYQVAISDTDGKATMYMVSPSAAEDLRGLPEWWDKIASFVPGHIEKHLERAAPYVHEIEVETLSLASFMRKNGLQKPTLLEIDVEGHDLAVLRSYDFSIGAPTLVLVEKRHLSNDGRTELIRLLSANRYRVVLQCKYDVLAFRSTVDGLASLSMGICRSVLSYLKHRAARGGLSL
jgi:FkbM family methyltransferase